VAGLLNSNLRGTLKLFAPQNLQQAVTLVKRSAHTESSITSTNSVNAISEHQIKPKESCQACNSIGHTALQCRKFRIVLRKANPNGFQATYPQQNHNSNHFSTQQPVYRQQAREPKYGNFTTFRQSEQQYQPRRFIYHQNRPQNRYVMQNEQLQRSTTNNWPNCYQSERFTHPKNE